MKLIILFALISNFIQAQNEIIGKYWSPKKDGKIEIFKKSDNKFYGKFIWIKNDRKDIENPDEKLKARMVSSIEFLYGFDYIESNIWENGKIYDPKSGKTYSCNIKRLSNGDLEVRGFIGFSLLGRTELFPVLKE